MGLLYVKKDFGSTEMSDEGADSKVAKSALARVAPFYYERINFFVVQGLDFMKERGGYGIKWAKLPSFTIVTPRKNYYPIA